jgi:fucose permease
VLVMGAVGSLTLVLIPAILADRHGSRRAIAIVEANILAAATGAMAGVLIGLAEWSSIGWRGALLLSLLAPLVLVRRYRDVPLAEARRRTETEKTGAGRLPVAYWAYWATVVLSVGVEFGLIFWGADFLREAGLSEGAAATTVSLFLWGMVAGRMAGRQIARRVATTRLLPLALVVSGAGFLVFWLAPVAVVAVVGLFVAGFGVANLYPLTVSLALGTAADRSDEAGARLSLASGTAILVAPFLLGALADAVGIRAAYTVVPIFLVSALVVSRLGQRLAEVQMGTNPVREAR